MNTQNPSLPATRTSSRDFFLYILSIIALFASVISFNSLIFQYVDFLFPNALDMYPSYNAVIRSSIATLVVMFPVFVGLSWFLRADIIAHPEKRDMGIRKFLIHFTLFIAALVIIIDLITLINNFLNGELTTRFVLKVITVLLTAIAVFAYYFWDLKRETVQSSRPSKILAFGTSAVILISIFSGFFIIGSPNKARLQNMDGRRTSDLSMIQNEIINYWIQKEKLPGNLSELKNDISGFTPPLDPATKVPYEYKILTSLSFELCANYSLKSEKNDASGSRGDYYPTMPYPYYSGDPKATNWDHPDGRACFSRTIDPQIYKPKK